MTGSGVSRYLIVSRGMAKIRALSAHQPIWSRRFSSGRTLLADSPQTGSDLKVIKADTVQLIKPMARHSTRIHDIRETRSKLLN